MTANTSVGSHTISPSRSSGMLTMLKLVGTTISRRKALYFCTLMPPIEISGLLRRKLNRPTRRLREALVDDLQRGHAPAHDALLAASS